jgi:hypothetical protein
MPGTDAREGFTCVRSLRQSCQEFFLDKGFLPRYKHDHEASGTKQFCQGTEAVETASHREVSPTKRAR